MKKVVIFIFLCFAINAYSQVPYVKDNSLSGTWRITWKDEFKSKKYFKNNWTAENKAPSHILSSRWSENTKIKNGNLYLLNKKENRGGKDWTTGSVTCNRQFKYGFFECRMKISKASGLNNSFWFYQWSAKEGHSFEIDVVESHYPNKIQTNIHDCGSKENSYRKQNALKHVYEEGNLFDSYHIYGLCWKEDTIDFYLDGKKIRSVPNRFCYDFANMVLGTAVLNWAGEVSDAIDGTKMIVDYVRVFELD